MGYGHGHDSGYLRGKLEGYKQGKHEGYNYGKEAGYGMGYANGNKSGFMYGQTAGYSTGFSQGHTVGHSSAPRYISHGYGGYHGHPRAVRPHSPYGGYHTDREYKYYAGWHPQGYAHQSPKHIHEGAGFKHGFGHGSLGLHE